MKNKKVLYILQEMTPYVPETPQSALGHKLATTTQEAGCEVRNFMPKYSCINERRNQLHEVIRLSGLNIIIDDTDHPLIIKVATLQPSRMQVYFIDNDDYFEPQPDKRLETVALPEDNDERMIFYVRGVLETVKKLRWTPDVIHCSGWISALAPAFIKKQYADDPSFDGSKIVYTLTADSFDGALDPRFVDKLIEGGFTAEQLEPITQEPVDCLTLNKMAIDNADAIMIGHPDVDPVLVEYAKATGKPVMEYSETPDTASFYRSLLAD